MRELKMMADGRASHHWDLFASLIFHSVNPNLPRGRKLKMSQIHPYLKQKERYLTEEEFRDWLYGGEKNEAK